MIDLKSIRLEDVAPENLLHDKTVADLAKIISDKMNQFSVYAYKLNYEENYRELPEDVIDHLLWENHMFQDEEGLLLVDTLEEKIQLLEAAVDLHRYKGTPFAVERALEAVNMPGEVTEWFQENSQPYYFAVELQVNDKINRVESARKLVLHYKNKRSWFDGFVLVLEDGEIVIFDDSYDYPVYYKTCGEFSGEKEFTQMEIGTINATDDAYDYIVEYPESVKEFTQVDLSPITAADDSYSYIKRFPVTGEMETLTKGHNTLHGASSAAGDLYDYQATYPVCGEFYAEGDG